MYLGVAANALRVVPRAQEQLRQGLHGRGAGGGRRAGGRGPRARNKRGWGRRNDGACPGGGRCSSSRMPSSIRCGPAGGLMATPPACSRPAPGCSRPWDAAVEAGAGQRTQQPLHLYGGVRQAPVRWWQACSSTATAERGAPRCTAKWCTHWPGDVGDLAAVTVGRQGCRLGEGRRAAGLQAMSCIRAAWPALYALLCSTQ